MAPESPTASGLMTIQWRGPDGSVVDLFDPPNLFILPGIVGFGAGPRSVISDALPRGYAFVRGVSRAERTITLPVQLVADTMHDFLARRDALIVSLVATERLGSGQLVVTRTDGQVRAIDAYYAAGMEGADDLGLPRETFPLQLFCPRPWRDLAARTVVFPYSAARNYLSPYMTVSPSQSLGRTTVVVDGSLPTPPTWWFDGPFSSVTASGPAGSFTLLRPAVAGERFTVVTDTAQLSATSSNGGGNLIPDFAWPGSSLWPLLPGRNDLTLTLEGAQVGTSATLLYEPWTDAP